MVKKLDRIKEHYFKNLYQNAAEKYESDAHITLGSEYGMQRRISSFFKVFEKCKIEKAKILDIGCGPGVYARKLYDLDHDVTAIDQIDSIVKLAKKRSNGRAIDFCVANAYKLNFKDNSFDIIITIGLFQHLSDYLVVMEEGARVLKKKGGIFLLITLNSFCLRVFFKKIVDLLSNRRDMEKRYNPYIMKEKLRKLGFANIQIEEVLLLPTKLRYLHNYKIINTLIYILSPVSMLIAHEFLITASFPISRKSWK